jgi:hypothetical protein
VAEILDNLAFQRPKRKSAKNKILQGKTLRQYLLAGWLAVLLDDVGRALVDPRQARENRC